MEITEKTVTFVCVCVCPPGYILLQLGRHLPPLSFQDSTAGARARSDPATQARSAQRLDPRAQGPAPRLRAQSRGGRPALSGLKVTAAEHPAGPCSRCSFSRPSRGTSRCSSRDPRGEASRTPSCPSPGPRTGSRAKPRLSTDNEIVAAAGGE